MYIDMHAKLQGLKTDSLGRTVFHYAYMCGNPDIIAMMKEHRYLKQSSNDNSIK